MTLHRVLNLTLPDLNRTLELIQKQVQTSTQPATQSSSSTSSSSGSGSSSASVGPQGPQGPTGPAGADGTAGNLMVGVNLQSEILQGPDGSVLTDEWGLALMGVNATSTILTGSDTITIGVLNAS